MDNSLTIFYTDDDPEDLDFFKEIVDIIDEDVVVVTYNSGHELLKALEHSPQIPNIVFLDLNMPGLNGFETLKRVKDSVKCQDIPVVIFSTASDDNSIEKSRELGASYYLPKSGIFDQLKKSIEHALKINWESFYPGKNNFVYNY